MPPQTLTKTCLTFQPCHRMSPQLCAFARGLEARQLRNSNGWLSAPGLMVAREGCSSITPLAPDVGVVVYSSHRTSLAALASMIQALPSQR